MRGAGAMAAIELAYRLDLDNDSWLRALAGVACSALGDPGLPQFAAIYRSHDTGFTYDHRVFQPHDDALVRAVDRVEGLNPKWVKGQKYRGTVCETASDLARRHHLPGAFARMLMRRTLGGWGYADAVQVQGAVLDHVSIGITAGLRTARELPSRLKNTWRRVGIHMAAGLRLRRDLADHGQVLVRAGLVLERSGSIAHAAPEVAADRDLRDRLRDCARRVDAARGPLATDAPEQAVALWEGLFEGRWSVLEVYDTDGRVYVVACENEPVVAETRALTRRERQVLQLASRGQADDLIAYTLGISVSAVQTHLTRGLARSGIKSRTRLMRVAATLDASFAKDAHMGEQRQP